jgi:hypothetical protein
MGGFEESAGKGRGCQIWLASTSCSGPASMGAASLRGFQESPTPWIALTSRMATGTAVYHNPCGLHMFLNLLLLETLHERTSGCLQIWQRLPCLQIWQLLPCLQTWQPLPLPADSSNPPTAAETISKWTLQALAAPRYPVPGAQEEPCKYSTLLLISSLPHMKDINASTPLKPAG